MSKDIYYQRSIKKYMFTMHVIYIVYTTSAAWSKTTRALQTFDLEKYCKR